MQTRHLSGAPAVLPCHPRSPRLPSLPSTFPLPFPCSPLLSPSLPPPFSLPFPSFPLPSVLSFCSSALPSRSFPSPPFRNRPPYCSYGSRPLESLGALALPATKWYLMNFRLKISPLLATIFRSFFQEIKHQTGGTGWPSGNILDRHSINTWDSFTPNEHYKTAIQSECTVSQGLGLFSQLLHSKLCTE